MLSFLQLVFDFHLEIVAFVLVNIAIGLWLDRRLLRPNISSRSRAGIWSATAALVAGGVLFAYHAGEQQRAWERLAIEGLAPTYATELALRGHDRVRLETPPDDPLYGSLIERQLAWQQLNENVQDIYTMRLDGDGRPRLIVDSETDYDHDGVFRGQREARTPIGEVYPKITPAMAAVFAGQIAYEDMPVTDRWGTWVSAYAPIHKADGSLDGMVGVDFSAGKWLAAILWSRCAALSYATLLIVVWLGGMSLMALLRADICALKMVQNELAHAARLDRLTGLPNRLLFLDRLQQTVNRSRRTGKPFGLMFLDFDRFKLINDSLGHEMGDTLLIEISRRLRSQLRFEDSISCDVEGASAGRLGGDEFVVLLDEISQLEDATEVAERLLEVLAAPYRLGHHDVVSTASIGIVVGDGSYERAEDALRDADTAMYEAKHAGKACYVVFDASMRQRVQRNMRLENELRRALADETGQLSLAYQPIVSLQTGELCGVEALLRWQHPDEGDVSPREFIPIAEESGLSVLLGEWVIGESCRQLRDWTDRLGAAAPGRIAINLSRKQFLQPDLPGVLSAALESHDISAERLQLEIAENALGRDLGAAIDTMKRLKETGVRIAIDHFGNECSSFASLHEFPVDVVKIDNSLLKTLEQSQATAALIHSLAVLARNLGIVMMAEGVERPTQIVALQELGCHFGQGYYFARAAAPREIESQFIFAPTLPYCVEGTREFQDRWSERLPALKSLAFEEPGAVV